MEQADLESYQYQLAQVKQAYAADPTNAEIVTLKEELESLIKLCHEYLGAAQASTSSKPAQTDSPKPAVASASKPQKRKAPDAAPYANPAKDIKPGDECLARYSGDGKMYPAKVISIGGSSENTVFSVIFKGYESSELVSAADVKAMSVDKKRQLELQAEEEEREKRRKKNAKKSETRQQKNQEQLTKQAAWQSFAKKSVSGKAKKVHIPGVAGESMFKTPDNPYGKAETGVQKGTKLVLQRDVFVFQGLNKLTLPCCRLCVPFSLAALAQALLRFALSLSFACRTDADLWMQLALLDPAKE